MSQAVIAPIAEYLVRTTLRVNDAAQELSHDPRLTLLDAIGDMLGLTGTKKGCDQGACAAHAPSSSMVSVPCLA
jgi:xanthine dehydrogenase iron-sulfur cluster and FAD-binding subunit A